MLSVKDLGGVGIGIVKNWENWKVEVGEGGRGEGKEKKKIKRNKWNRSYFLSYKYLIFFKI